MTRKVLFMGSALLALLGGLPPAQAQTKVYKFDDAAYVTCRDAQSMTPDARRSLATFLAEHSARHRGVTIPEDARGGNLGMLVRGGCTLAPDTYLFTVIDRAILAELDKLPRR